MRRLLFNAGYKNYAVKRKPYRKPSHCSSRLRFAEKCSDLNLVIGKMQFSLMNLILKLLTEKIDLIIRRLPSESDKPFCFRPRAQGVVDSLASGEL